MLTPCLYSCFVGGLTAVIWTDFAQTGIMLAGATALAILSKSASPCQSLAASIFFFRSAVLNQILPINLQRIYMHLLLIDFTIYLVCQVFNFQKLNMLQGAWPIFISIIEE